MLILGFLAAGGTVLAVRRHRDGRTPMARGEHVLTVYKPLTEVRETQLPGSLREVADRVEIALAAAPGDRGTEIRVRVPDDSPVTDGEVRRALRETRSLLETGDVLLPSGPATTTPTPWNRPLRAATAHGREGGLL